MQPGSDCWLGDIGPPCDAVGSQGCSWWVMVTMFDGAAWAAVMPRVRPAPIREQAITAAITKLAIRRIIEKV